MSTDETKISETILELERAALDRWGRGDPDGFLDLSAPDVSYFDPFVETRIDGAASLRSVYDQLRGKIRIDRFAMLEPRVQVIGDVAVLTFRFESQGSEGLMVWNTTEVYRRADTGWRIIHAHWAFHRPRLAARS